MPNALTLDHKAQKLYWGDARLDKIERCEYDGSNRVVSISPVNIERGKIPANNKNILNYYYYFQPVVKVIPQHPFDLAVYGNYLYWTDWVLHAVLRVNKYTGEEVVWLRKDVAKPMGIVAIANDTADCKCDSLCVCGLNSFMHSICCKVSRTRVWC